MIYVNSIINKRGSGFKLILDFINQSELLWNHFVALWRQTAGYQGEIPGMGIILMRESIAAGCFIRSR